MGIGVAGGRGLDGTKPYLGTLGIICQPYSFVEWSMNWDFLSAEFRPAPGKLKHNLNANLNASQFRWFNQILIDWYQILDGQTYLSPLPMQLCAPGYIMRGLEVSAGDEFIRGITAVYCVQPEIDPKDAPCLADDSAYPCKIDTYVAGTFGDPPRPISQYIGAPGAGGTLKKLNCAPGEYASGLVVSKKTSEPTRQISLSCAPY